MRDTLLRLLRVPSEPSPPDGTPESIRIFRAGKNYLRWRLAMWGLAQFGVLVSILFSVAVMWSVELRLTPMVWLLWEIAEWAAVAVALAAGAIGFFLQRLNFELR